MRIKSNKHNKRFYLQYFDNKGEGYWRALGQKIEVRQPSVKLQIVTCGLAFNLEILRDCPFEEEPQIGVSEDDILAKHSSLSLAAGNLTDSIQLLKDLITEKELEKLEKKHSRVKCSDEYLDKLLKEMDQCEPAELDCPSPGPSNMGFLASTHKKGTPSSCKSHANRVSFGANDPLLGTSSHRRSEGKKPISSRVIQEQSDEDDDTDFFPKRRPGLFRDSEVLSEETSNTLQVCTKARDFKDLFSPNKCDDINEKLLSLKKAKRAEYESRPSKASQNQKEQPEEVIVCCICHSRKGLPS